MSLSPYPSLSSILSFHFWPGGQTPPVCDGQPPSYKFPSTENQHRSRLLRGETNMMPKVVLATLAVVLILTALPLGKGKRKLLGAPGSQGCPHPSPWSCLDHSTILSYLSYSVCICFSLQPYIAPTYRPYCSTWHKVDVWENIKLQCLFDYRGHAIITSMESVHYLFHCHCLCWVVDHSLVAQYFFYNCFMNSLYLFGSLSHTNQTFQIMFSWYLCCTPNQFHVTWTCSYPLNLFKVTYDVQLLMHSSWTYDVQLKNIFVVMLVLQDGSKETKRY